MKPLNHKVLLTMKGKKKGSKHTPERRRKPIKKISWREDNTIPRPFDLGNHTMKRKKTSQKRKTISGLQKEGRLRTVNNLRSTFPHRVTDIQASRRCR